MSIAPGARVRVESGELAGLAGTVVRTAGEGDTMIAQCDFGPDVGLRALPAAACALVVSPPGSDVTVSLAPGHALGAVVAAPGGRP